MVAVLSFGVEHAALLTVRCNMQTSSGSPGMVPIGLAATLIIGLCVLQPTACLCCSRSHDEAGMPPALHACRVNNEGRQLGEVIVVFSSNALLDIKRCCCTGHTVNKGSQVPTIKYMQENLY